MAKAKSDTKKSTTEPVVKKGKKREKKVVDMVELEGLMRSGYELGIQYTPYEAIWLQKDGIGSSKECINLGIRTFKALVAIPGVVRKEVRDGITIYIIK